MIRSPEIGRFRIALWLGVSAALIAVLSSLPAGGAAKPRAGVAASRPSVDAGHSPVTFNRDIAAIIFQNCSSCHRPGEAGPFSLLSYSDVKKHGHQIVAVTQLRIMPPWLPEPQDLKFADERRLSSEQIDQIRDWVDEGEAEGSAADLPPLPKFVEGWQLGPPDLIVKASKPYSLVPAGRDLYWNFILPIPIDQTRWVKAVEIRPGDKRLVHHANILVDRFELSRRSEKEPGAGFAGMDLRIESEVFDPESHFLFWKPGSIPYVEPDGLALRLDKGTDLVLNTHLQPSGKPEIVQPSVGLYFTDKPETKFPMLLQLQRDSQLDIPPGEKNFVITDRFQLPIAVALLGIYPHAHYLGKDLLAEAILPDGQTKTLIHIEHWDLNWQAVYRYEKPVLLPRGTVIAMRYVYDNSAENIRNPNDPPKRVRAGNSSVDEMSHLWLQVLPEEADPAQRDPRKILQEAMARHYVALDPADYVARYNLGAMLEDRGDVRGGIEQYELALRIRPDDAVIHNTLGSTLLAAGNAPDAIAHFRAALRARPEYFDARYNLGIVLASQGDFVEALSQLEEAVRLRPDDAGAQANLGGVLAQIGKLAEAKSCLQRALQIDPGHRLARENLAAVDEMLAGQAH
ncbi:MAG: tetratricopeptide repeat protein [Terriglobales bacterium]|jgi:tetratricopeptide (TPR) repeat protein/mono/diheme cytochrome c family protein